MKYGPIPEVAVEAALRAFDPAWDSTPAEWRDYFMRRARAALEAAIPLLEGRPADDDK